jgi:hypothetical protein
MMANTVFLQGAIGSIFIPQTRHNHTRSAPLDDDIPTAIKCSDCEPFLVKLGGVYDPAAVPPTQRQLDARERAKEAGNSAVAEAAKALAGVATSTTQRYSSDDEFERRVEEGVRLALKRGVILGSQD